MEPKSIDRIFWEAAQLASAGERDAYLDRACATDVALRRRVEQLLQARSKADGFLEIPALDPVTTVDGPALTERPGTVIGPYKLLEQIGEGGFGVVFLAEQQQPVRRKVALKVLKPGMDSRQVIARFEAERQALALMDHPHIAHIFDGGSSDSGRPYFVMELVRGIPITDYCDQSQLTPQERLPLFVAVCQAVQHAHQKGLIHRDLKPANVLVTLHDGVPVVKVIDFGIAKALGQQLTDRTLYTGFAQMIGTPLYMAPEQAALSGLDVDTRSDIYALGVLLYELLTGTTPFDKERLRTADYDEMRRIIREEEPPRPSTRLSTLGPAAATVSAQRKSDPRRLSQLCRGELDWIVMKCLEKDRNHRYETASALAADAQRYLHDEPVLACPPSAWYRFRKLARRHKGAFVTAWAGALMTLLVVVGLAVSNVLISREKNEKVAALHQAKTNEEAADQQRQQAEANLLLARQAVDEMYTQVAGELGGQPYMQLFQRQLLQKALRFYQKFAAQKSGDPALRLETAIAALRVCSIQYSLGQRRQAKQACDDAIVALEALASELPTGPQRRFQLGGAYRLRGSILAEAGRHQQAEMSYRQALALYGELVAEHPEVPGYRSNLASTHSALAYVLLGRPREAEKAFREAIRLCEELVAERRDPTGYRGQLIGSFTALGNFLSGAGRSAEAERAFQQAIDLIEESGEALDRTGARGLRPRAESGLGQVLAATGRREAAEKAYRRAIAEQERLADRFPDVTMYRGNLATDSARLAALLTQAGRRDEAALFRRSARDLLAKLEVEFLDEGELLGHLAGASRALVEAGDLEGAEQFLRRAVVLADKLAAEDAAEPGNRGSVAGTLNTLGRLLRTQPGEAAAALHCHEQAVALATKLVADFPEQPQYRNELVRSHFGRGIMLWRTERLAEAVQAFQHALDASRPPSGMPDSAINQTQVAAVHNEWAWVLATCADAKFRDPGRAVELAKRAVELAPHEGGFWNTLGAAHYRARDWKAAIKALEKSKELLGDKDLSFNAFFLAMTQWRLGQEAEARTWYDKAVQWMDQTQANSAELRRFRAEAEETLEIKNK
jgi:serine/threonine protein kinase/tetratricopeptide (TPR) repeat protein